MLVVVLTEMVKQSMEHFRVKLAICLLRRSATNHGRQQGFTLIELLVVILMAGILASIAAPGWLGYLDKRRVGTTQDNVFTAIRSAQLRAQERRQGYQFSIREDDDGFIEWATHPSDIDPVTTVGVVWQKSPSNTVEINTETDLENDDVMNPLEPYYIRFDYRGNVEIPPASALPQQLTFSSVNTQGDGAGDGTAQSIFVQTIIGTLLKE